MSHWNHKLKARVRRRGAHFTWFVIDAFDVVYAQARGPLPRRYDDARAQSKQALATVQSVLPA